MRNSETPAYLPVDHRAIFSGYRPKTKAVAAKPMPWLVRLRIGVFIPLALGAWIIAL